MEHRSGTRLKPPGTWWWDPQGTAAASTMSSRGRMSCKAEKVVKPGWRKTARFVARASDHDNGEDPHTIGDCKSDLEKQQQNVPK